MRLYEFKERESNRSESRLEDQHSQPVNPSREKLAELSENTDFDVEAFKKKQKDE